MKEEFFKFPSTPHLATLASIDVRSDKVLSEAERSEFLQHKLIVEEKVDGANLGISFDNEGTICLQNRGSYLHLPLARQWKKLEQWVVPKIDTFFDVLSDRYILFGEWCYAQHSVFYNRLPDWFLGFDLYDKQVGKFLSLKQRTKKFKAMQIAPVPFIASGRFSFSELVGYLSQSKISDKPAEGLYMRLEQGEWLLPVEEHWSRSTIKPNRLNPENWNKIGSVGYE